MGKLTGDSKKSLEYVEGRENIAAAPHRVARMRFVLNDPPRADTQAIGSLASAKGTLTQTGQSQVIIGSEVSIFYNDFAEVAGIEGVSKDTVKKTAMQNQTLLQRIMSSLAEIFAPPTPAIIVGGLILRFRSIIGEIALFDGGTKTLAQMSVFQVGTNSFLWLIGEAVFYFPSVCIARSITKEMGTIQALGIVLGIALVSPQPLNVYSAAAAAAAEIPKWSFGFLQMDIIGYQAQVLPVVLAGFTLVYLGRLFRKICPAVTFMIVVPFCSLIISVVVAHGILGPIGWKIGAMIPDCVNTGLTSPFKKALAGILGFFYALLVITGLHHMSDVTGFQLVVDFGGTTLWPMAVPPNIAQGPAVLATILLQKNDAETKEVSIPACISCHLGVAESAMFGVNLKYGLPFIYGVTGSAVGAVLSVVSGVRTSAIGVRGVPGILSTQPQYTGLFAIAMELVILIPFCLIYAIERKKGIGGNQDGG